jgi:hypothetical protein
MDDTTYGVKIELMNLAGPQPWEILRSELEGLAWRSLQPGTTKLRLCTTLLVLNHSNNIKWS